MRFTSCSRRKTSLERIDEFLSRDDGAFYAERIQMLRRIMFGELPEESSPRSREDAEESSIKNENNFNT
jgi:hypothetical protein